MTIFVKIAQIAATDDPSSLFIVSELLDPYRSCTGRYLVMDPSDVDWMESTISRNNRYTSALAALTATLSGRGKCDVLDLATMTIYSGCADAADWSSYRDTLPPEPRSLRSHLEDQIGAMLCCIDEGAALEVYAHAKLAGHIAIQILN
jgi:hypothetical protein